MAKDQGYAYTLKAEVRNWGWASDFLLAPPPLAETFQAKKRLSTEDFPKKAHLFLFSNGWGMIGTMSDEAEDGGSSIIPHRTKGGTKWHNWDLLA